MYCHSSFGPLNSRTKMAKLGEDRYFCQSADLCLCEDQLKNSFFTDRKQTNFSIAIEGGFLKIAARRCKTSRGN